MALPLIFIYMIRLLKKQLFHSFVFNRHSSHGGDKSIKLLYLVLIIIKFLSCYSQSVRCCANDTVSNVSGGTRNCSQVA